MLLFTRALVSNLVDTVKYEGPGYQKAISKANASVHYNMKFLRARSTYIQK